MLVLVSIISSLLIPAATISASKTEEHVVISYQDENGASVVISRDDEQNVFRTLGGNTAFLLRDPFHRLQIALCVDGTEVFATSSETGGTLLVRRPQGLFEVIGLASPPASNLAVNDRSTCRIAVLLDDGTLVLMDIEEKALWERRGPVEERIDHRELQVENRLFWLSDNTLVSSSQKQGRLHFLDASRKNEGEESSVVLSFIFVGIWSVEGNVYVLDDKGQFGSLDESFLFTVLEEGPAPVAVAKLGAPLWINQRGDLVQWNQQRRQLEELPFLFPANRKTFFVERLPIQERKGASILVLAANSAWSGEVVFAENQSSFSFWELPTQAKGMPSIFQNPNNWALEASVPTLRGALRIPLAAATGTFAVGNRVSVSANMLSVNNLEQSVRPETNSSNSSWGCSATSKPSVGPPLAIILFMLVVTSTILGRRGRRLSQKSPRTSFQH
ncbi:MAG: hypothetical protein GY822_01040 [Deltaproteobacteria bacterium]|nr:hypothetical protein [Deltaproteobacteria bacterium]